MSIDPGGNLIGRTEGKTNGISPIVIGSHSDTVPHGGRFRRHSRPSCRNRSGADLERKGDCPRASTRSDRFPRPEEPSEFGISCVGSRAIAGLLDDTMLNAKAPNGETLKGRNRANGWGPREAFIAIAGSRRYGCLCRTAHRARPDLRIAGIPIGVVTDILGISRTKIVVERSTRSLRYSPMDSRRDALVGAARIIETAYRKASVMAKARQHVVATVGRLSVTPNAINAVPGRAELIFEVRSESDAILRQFAKELVEETMPFCEELRLIVDSVPLSDGFPTACAAVVQTRLR